MAVVFDQWLGVGVAQIGRKIRKGRVFEKCRRHDFQSIGLVDDVGQARKPDGIESVFTDVVVEIDLILFRFQNLGNHGHQIVS